MGDLWVTIVPEHVWKQCQPAGRGQEVREPAAHRRHRPVPGGRGEERSVRAPGGQQELLARRPQGRRDHLPDLPERGHHGPGPQERRHPRRLGAQRPAAADAQERAGGLRLRLRHQRLRRAGVQLLHGQRLQGQPGAARRQLPPRPQLGHRQAEARPGRVPGLRPARRFADAERLLAAAARLPLGPGVRRQGVRLRPREVQGGARRRRLQGRQR